MRERMVAPEGSPTAEGSAVGRGAHETMRRMRVAVVTGIFPPDVGGPATHAADLADGLRAGGHAVRVVSLWDRPQVRSEPGLVLFPRRWPWPVRHAAVAGWIATNRR